MQTAKLIDVTRTYVPVDPKAFPQSMHTSGQEESPENKIPVMAYAGQNFLPTSYGYKSYFGTNEKIDIAALSARTDAVFIFQTATLRNILIALTEEGIYTCESVGESSWTQSVEYTPPSDAEAHYEWSWCILNNELYFYLQGKESYWRCYSTADDPVLFEEIEPNFLNMEGQLGIFKAGSRIGFWDSENSVAWSSIDDYSDFTPSVTTLAGSAKFTELVGNIVTIRSHGDGFMIYATKSILYIQKAVGELFQWSPKVLMTNGGVAYPRQVAVAAPDTLHFAYTNQGMYKIDSAQLEVIIPEVWDFFTKIPDPKYLNVLQGRFLFIEVFDSNLLTGKIAFTEGTVPEDTLIYPGVSEELAPAIEEALLTSKQICGVLGGFNEQAFTDQAPPPGSGLPGAIAAPEDAGDVPDYQPEYTCHLKMPRFSGADIEWVNIPCPITDYDGQYMLMSPNFDINTEITKTVTGDMYLDGRMTIERFVALQTALWQIEESAITAMESAVRTRALRDTQTIHASGPLLPEEQYTNVCENKILPQRFTKPYFGMNGCSFWLTRYAAEAQQIITVERQSADAGDTRTGAGGPTLYYVGNKAYLASSCGASKSLVETASGRTLYERETPAAAYYTREDAYGQERAAYVVQNYSYDSPTGIYGENCVALVPQPTGGEKHLVLPVSGGLTMPITQEDIPGRYKKTMTKGVYNLLKPIEYPPVPDTAYCELTGWFYTATDGSRKKAPMDGCDLLDSAVDGSGGVDGERQVPMANTDSLLNNLFPLADDGQFCSIPFDPITIPGEPPVLIEWPEEEVTYPGATFILRDGSYAPLYPVARGTYVYDLHLKKWGKYVGNYQHLLDYSPLNSTATAHIDPRKFGIMGGIFDTAGAVRLFDAFPVESHITYGKIGFQRAGYTSLEELRVDFKEVSTGNIRVDGSINGRDYNVAFTSNEDFTNARSHTLYGVKPAVWHNVTISGHYDISYMEYRGFKQGRR